MAAEPISKSSRDGPLPNSRGLFAGREAMIPWITTPLLLAILVLIWHVYVRASGISPFILPAPGAVELAAPPRRESPPTVPDDPTKKGVADYDDEDEEQEEAATFPRPRNTRTIQIERFLPAGQIDSRYFEKPYYILSLIHI